MDEVEPTTGDWPEPDALTPDEHEQLGAALAGVRVMLRKALYHRRTTGHYCTFAMQSHIRGPLGAGWILQEGGITCEGPAWPLERPRVREPEGTETFALDDGSGSLVLGPWEEVQ